MLEKAKIEKQTTIELRQLEASRHSLQQGQEHKIKTT